MQYLRDHFLRTDVEESSRELRILCNEAGLISNLTVMDPLEKRVYNIKFLIKLQPETK